MCDVECMALEQYQAALFCRSCLHHCTKLDLNPTERSENTCTLSVCRGILLQRAVINAASSVIDAAEETLIMVQIACV